MLIKPKKKFWLQGTAPFYKSAVIATTTWNPSDKDAGITLSGVNLIGTVTANAFSVVRAIANHSTGKYYHEVSYSAVGAVFAAPGVANASLALNNFIGNTNGIAWLFDGRVYVNNVNVITIQTWALNDALCIATDLTNSRIWFRANAGNWNNSGTANPATNTGGIDISGVAGPDYPSAGGNSIGDAFTANFGGSAFAQTAPSGFGNW